MRIFFVISILALSLSSTAQQKIFGNAIYNLNGYRMVWHSTSDSILKVLPDRVYYGGKAVQTTNATPTTIATIAIPDESAGIIEVYIIGREIGTAGKITGKKTVGYAKDGGTLTLDAITDILPTTATGTISTASWTITTSSNNIIIQVTGVAATTINWKTPVIQTDN